MAFSIVSGTKNSRSFWFCRKLIDDLFTFMQDRFSHRQLKGPLLDQFKTRIDRTSTGNCRLNQYVRVKHNGYW